jgi:uncharacterized protein (DUF433 family)
VITTGYRYIVKVPGVCSGSAIVEGTRIGVHDIIAMRNSGADEDEVIRSFPRITRAQIYECWAYYEDHRAEIDPLVNEQLADPK